MDAATVGPAAFGIVIGWITYRTLTRRAEAVLLSDIATVVGAVGGAPVAALFKDPQSFGAYCIGLLAGFFAYLIALYAIKGKEAVGKVMGD